MEDEKKIEQLESDIKSQGETINELLSEKKDLRGELENAQNDKTALYDLIIDLTDEITRDINDRVSEVREAAKAYVK